ncbi:Protein NEDD1 [Quillaja saponaria]|uniref:Protein NEDD1 n=1 Tax=Quillaja saponaria TaxID=32244 RepID=A0AAD7LLH5_QUISA|nr:Protein NEDD1 [Quillaja saponaria]
MASLAASGGDTVKLFDVSVKSDVPCTLSYTPSAGSQVNAVKWYHANLFWLVLEMIRRSRFGERMDRAWGPFLWLGLTVETTLRSLHWLSASATRHLDTCVLVEVVKFLSGDLILHCLASGARAAELRDPSEQVLRVLAYSPLSQHLLVTAGDDGTEHLWDTTGSTPKVSWVKQHSAPTAGRPSSCISYEAPFSNLAFTDDGWMLAAGTSNGCVALHDVRGKPQPFVILHAYSSSEAVASLCWQRSKPAIVNESNCTAEISLVGDSVGDSIVLPDPMPSATSSTQSLSTAVSSSRNPGA